MSDFVSNGWHLYVTAIVIGGLLFCVLVLVGSARHKVIRDAQGNIEQTTGHVWDGDLRELNNPLPRWWVGMFVLTIVFSVGYLVVYPGLGSRTGTFGWTSVKEYQDEVAKAKLAEGVVYARFDGQPVPALARERLAGLGLTLVAGGRWCTVSDASRFFSFRRDGVTGRQAACIWLDGRVGR